MKCILILAAVAACASAGVIAPFATTIVRAPAYDSAVIKSDRLGGNFAYSTAENHAYAAISPVVQHVATPVAVSYSAPAVVQQSYYVAQPALAHSVIAQPALTHSVIAQPAYTVAHAPAVVAGSPFVVAGAPVIAAAPVPAVTPVEDAAPAESAPAPVAAEAPIQEPVPAEPVADSADSVSVESA